MKPMNETNAVNEWNTAREAGPKGTLESKVRFDGDAVYIEGTPVILLCSSVFYFRIPRGLWRDRLRKVKEAGYNAIDVYFPWNHHEREPGVWDFSGERDVEAFLKLAAEEGLWVVARPGPYICSEWDGGALPAHLFTDRQMRLRDNDPGFLQEVNRWFGRMMPILSRFELGKEGTVIAVQLDNELDFYDCEDPAGYISALRDMALTYGVNVPLFACAGQGDLYKASGHAEGVMPTCNFYPNDRDPEFEDKVVRYAGVLRGRGYPLCVTETNRSHFLLRRLLSGGAKLLGPYLQTSGTDFGFTNAINNWGKPLAFLTSDYDFHGMITPEGGRREEFYEGRLLGGLLRSMGSSLAKAAPVPSFFRVETELTVSSGMRYVLELDGGGYVIALPNVDQRDGSIRLHHGEQVIPQHTELKLAADRCPLLLYDFPLAQWGGKGSIRYSTAEVTAVRSTERKLTLVFTAERDSESEIAWTVPDAAEVVEGGAEVYGNGQELVLCYRQGVQGAAVIRCQDGSILAIHVLDRHRASRLLEITSDGELLFEAGAETEAAAAGQGEEAGPASEPVPLSLSWKKAGLPSGGAGLPQQWLELGDQAKPLEEAGIYRGMAWYEAKRADSVSKPILGVLLQDAGDILSVYAEGTYAGTVIPGGGHAYLPLEQPAEVSDLLIRAEIWGHTNFDDSVLPGLRLNSLKGLRHAVTVTRQLSLASHWNFQTCAPKQDGEPLSAGDLDSESCSIQSWGGWMTTRLPESGIYWKSFTASADADRWMLHVPGAECVVRVYVNRQYAGEVVPGLPFVDLTPYVEPGEEAEMALYMQRSYHQTAGRVMLYEGSDAVQWRVAGCQEEQLWQASEDAAGRAAVSELPVQLLPGELAWLQTDLPADLAAKCRKVRCEGRDVKLTAFFNGHLVGRLWLEGGGVRPHMTGGGQDVIYLPEPWYQAGDNRLSLLVEGIGEDAELRGFTWKTDF
ncbi:MULTISPECIES: beta-galactosidase [Paenibacillus]|uniref:beta-galactosidase n=1 Tax=Paenibacillus TaxID=44249 RepID=UPI0022B85D8A|nr:beta-galactosidase [Paenibacillus caseinilyticus]MCZ8518957.1 beta-galactosidase [Paenibacillus caseinilyticus]